MGSLYLGSRTIQEVDGKMMMGLSIYGVAVISGSLYSRFYGILQTLLMLCSPFLCATFKLRRDLLLQTILLVIRCDMYQVSLGCFNFNVL